jgi:hypothetical protein
LANGIILSPDEKTLYVTNGAIVYAFDVDVDGSLTNQREFGKLQGGTGGDGSASRRAIPVGQNRSHGYREAERPRLRGAAAG